MAKEILRTFGPKTHNALLAMSREWRRTGGGLITPAQIPGGTASPIVHVVRVSNATPDADGYPCEIREWDGSEWQEEFDEARVIDALGGSLSEDDILIARLVRATDDGMLVFAGILASGDSSDDRVSLTVVTDICLDDSDEFTFVRDGSNITDVQYAGATIENKTFRDLFTSALEIERTDTSYIGEQEEPVCGEPGTECCECCKEVSGLNNTGVGLSESDPDTNWDVDGSPAVACAVNAAWVANAASGASKWISYTATNESAGDCDGSDVYEYETTFTVADVDIAKLCGRYLADDGVNIYLNDTLVHEAAGGHDFGDWVSFEITTGFVAGSNTLRFDVHDTACTSTGLRVEFCI